MSEHKYNRIANGLMLVGIASALLFDSGRISHALAGTVGIVAGVAAIVLYFVNQERAQVREETQAQKASAKQGTIFVVDSMHSATRYPTIKAGDVWAVTIAQALHASDDETAWLYLAHHGGRRPRQHDIVSFGRSDVKNVELSPDDVAACAVEIIRGLSAGDDHDRWEFNFSRHGLRVSVKKGRAQRPAMRPQEDFDFGQMPATIQ